MRLSETNAAHVDTEKTSNPIVKAGEIIYRPIMVTARRISDTQYGTACFADFSFVDDPDATVQTVVFSSYSPAFDQLKALTAEELHEGLFVAVAPKGKTFMLVDPDDIPLDAPAASSAPSGLGNGKGGDAAQW